VREKFRVGEQVEMLCRHVRDGQATLDWLAGRVVQTDSRMVAVCFDTPVYSNDGWLVPDQTLWCTHGSRHVRRLSPGEPRAEAGGEPPAA
jgi:hypothetical protein